jgi:hypothetical protein
VKTDEGHITRTTRERKQGLRVPNHLGAGRLFLHLTFGTVFGLLAVPGEAVPLAFAHDAAPSGALPLSSGGSAGLSGAACDGAMASTFGGCVVVPGSAARRAAGRQHRPGSALVPAAFLPVCLTLAARFIIAGADINART